MKVQSLSEFLGTDLPPAEPSADTLRIEDITDAKAFADAVLSSYEFRQFIVNGLELGTLPSAIVTRLMDHSSWGSPAKRLELTGRDGKPIEQITEVRRVVVRPALPQDIEVPHVASVH